MKYIEYKRGLVSQDEAGQLAFVVEWDLCNVWNVCNVVQVVRYGIDIQNPPPPRVISYTIPTHQILVKFITVSFLPVYTFFVDSEM